MNPNEYQAKAKRTQCDYEKAAKRMSPSGLESGGEYGDEERLRAIRINHAVIGLIGELGEIASVLQKWIYYGKPFTVEEIQAKFSDEGGDCQWYLALLFDAIGVPMENILNANIAKLAVRYPDKFTELAAEIRDREAEAQAIANNMTVRDVLDTKKVRESLREYTAAQQIVCTKCLGVGALQGSKPCSECKGTGKIVVGVDKVSHTQATDKPPVDPTCTSCLGTGRIWGDPNNPSRVCPLCNGTGKTLPDTTNLPQGDTGPMS